MFRNLILGSPVSSRLFTAASKSKWQISQRLAPLASRVIVKRPLTVNHKKLSDVSVTKPIFTEEERKKVAADRLKQLEPYVSKLPEKWIPYAELMRLDKPAGTWYLFLPSAWAIMLAGFELVSPISQTLYILGLFGIGSIVMRGAGCTINDILDKNFDDKVIRTIERPIASGRVSKTNATKFLVAQLTVGLGVLLSLPLDCFLLGASSLSLVLTYPLFKRFTYYPQVALSACFNWGTLLGFAAMGDWNWGLMLPLYFATFNWCMIYDTIYAHQDKLWDVKAGVKSTALKWGANTKNICYGLASLQVSSLAFMGVYGALGPGFWIAGTIFSYRMINMIKRTNLDSIKSCWEAFNINVTSAKIFTVGILVDYILRLFGFI
ncbi:4-hydroxybenzoate octaprenyltransferase [Saccharomycopsis crataegensis]|uniref:4-hydroxybenzoate polyprenyltransferase, mitochondrial n=1 Tax=Saccharomycopsis crataegensis TaxID=43959 RepID=A0AAV5QFI9_9ASCO|nr:4-hydroxybenzoate octaprenyltransferase [Saccharomycopsis crataegensis]